MTSLMRPSLARRPFQVGDALHEIAVLFLDLVPLESCEVAEPQVDDGLGLLLAQAEAIYEAHLGGLGVLAGADDADDLVQIGDGDQQAFQDVGPLLGLVELEARPPDDDFLLVRDVVAQDVAKRQRLGDTVGQGEHVHAEGGLHGRVLVELVEHHLGHGLALQLDDYAHARTVGLVAQVGDLGDGLVAHQLGHLLDQLGLVHLIGDLGDYDGRLALLDRLGVGLCPHDHAPAAGLVALADAGAAQDEAAGGEVGPLQVAHEVGAGERRIVDEGDGGRDGLAQVVRRDVGGHAHGDARAAVDEQVGETRGQHHRLLAALVVVGGPVDRLRVDVAQHLRGDAGQTAFGVAHGGGGVAVDRAEVAVAVDQEVADGEGLRQTHQSIVDGGVAVRVEITHDVTHDAGALAIGPVGLHARVVHAEEHATVHGLEAVTNVGQGAPHDDAHGVVEIRGPHLVGDLYLLDAPFERLHAAARHRASSRSGRSP